MLFILDTEAAQAAIGKRVTVADDPDGRLQRGLTAVFCNVMARDRSALVRGLAGQHKTRRAQGDQTRQDLVRRIFVAGGGHFVQSIDDENLAPRWA